MRIFEWPHGKRAALSLTFDDARPSQADIGLPILNEFGVKATFFVSFNLMEERLGAWHDAAKSGHEIANHTVSHPCSGNFPFSRCNPLEEYSLDRMERELHDANAHIEKIFNITPRTFAYPCGQKFVGRGEELRSYVPLVARRFIAGRGFNDEAPNDPTFCDLAQLSGRDADNRPLDALMRDIEAALNNNYWLILCAHNVGARGYQTFDLDALAKICRFARDEKNGIWLDTVEKVAEFVKQTRA